MACRKPGDPVTSVDQVQVGMIVENRYVGTCRITEITGNTIFFEYVGLMMPEMVERRFFRNGYPIEWEGEYFFSFAELGATLDG